MAINSYFLDFIWKKYGEFWTIKFLTIITILVIILLINFFDKLSLNLIDFIVRLTKLIVVFRLLLCEILRDDRLDILWRNCKC